MSAKPLTPEDCAKQAAYYEMHPRGMVSVKRHREVLATLDAERARADEAERVIERIIKFVGAEDGDVSRVFLELRARAEKAEGALAAAVAERDALLTDVRFALVDWAACYESEGYDIRTCNSGAMRDLYDRLRAAAERCGHADDCALGRGEKACDCGEGRCE